MRNEISYYEEIQQFIGYQLKSNFRAKQQRDLHVYWGIGELKTNLKKIISKHPEECACAREFLKSVPPLSLDIFALITDTESFELLILEIKLVKSVGLREWSQLVGYCLVSGAKYGLLINIDAGRSTRLDNLLYVQSHMSDICTIVNGERREHLLGLMTWNSTTHNFEYSNRGAIKSLPELSDRLIDEF